MDLTEYVKQTSHWLSEPGPESDIVISSRIRLARNVCSFPFLSTAGVKERGEVERLIRDQIGDGGVLGEFAYFGLPAMNTLDRQFLVERHLISREHAFGKGPRGVALGGNQVVSIMVNEEDHLRIQGLSSGFRLRETFKIVNEIDDALEKKIDYAFSSQFGFQTVCPTNAGTGLRASVMLHLPALVMTRQIEKVFQAVTKINLAVRGLHGEGTDASGDFYQISNQATLGKSEEEILRNIEDVIPQIIKYERTVRDTLIETKKDLLEDKVWRSYGTLKFARSMASEEALSLLSNVRMGVNLGIICDVGIGALNELFVLTQPANLQKEEGRELTTGERDVARASFVRKRLGTNH